MIWTFLYLNKTANKLKESMLNSAEKIDIIEETDILYRTKGHQHGPITRLVSPGDLGEVMKPFVFLDSFVVDSTAPNNVGYHPHSGIVTVTIILEGSITYEDSTGKAGVLSAGDVEWMQAGGGVWHTASSVPEAGTMIKGFQLWLALPAAIENEPPESLYIESNQITQIGPARVIVGEYKGVSSPLPKISPITYLHVHLEDGESWTFDSPENHDVLWLAVNEGSIKIDGEVFSNEIAIFEAGSFALVIEAVGEANFVLGSAMKHPHPLVTGYYSVHTSVEALNIGEDGIQQVGEQLRSNGRINF